MENNGIAIVGMSLFCPGAGNVHDFWKNISGGVDSIVDAPDNVIGHEYFEGEEGAIDKFYCRRGGFCSEVNMDPLRYGILPVVADGMDPEHLMMLGMVEQALHDANIFKEDAALKKGCIVLGKGNFAGLIALRAAEIIRNSHFVANVVRSALPHIPEEEVQKIKKEYQEMQGRYQADTAIGTMPNLVVSMVANKFDIQGPAYTVDAACASGLLAVDQAIRFLESGECDTAIAGGLHTIQNPMFWSAFNMMGALSKRGVIAPFNEKADGLLIGQGGGIVVLKKLEKAIEDRNRIYAVIKGVGICSDGGGSHVMVTSTKGQVRTLKYTWDKAGLDPRNVGYVEAHGTGTPVGDKTEIATLTEFFGDNTHPTAYVGSIKSNIGHTMSAAGMMGLIKTALALYHRKIPPTLHCEKPLKEMFNSRFLPPQELIDWDESKYPLIAGVNAFGFGGINSHAVLTAYKENGNTNVPISRDVATIEPALIITAGSKEELLEKLDKNDGSMQADGNYRLVIFNPTKEKIKAAKIIIGIGKTWVQKQDIWFSCDPLISKGGKVVFVFPGFDMDIISETDSFSEYLGLPKLDYEELEKFYNKGKKRKIDRKGIQGIQGSKLSYNSWLNDMALKKIGIVPDLYTGFSIGEWNAAISAKLVTENSLHEVLMANVEGGDIEDTYFISVICGYETLKPLAEGIPNLYLSVDCCPNTVLMCGDSVAKDQLEVILKKNKIPYFIKPFKSGFHTPFLEYLTDEIREACKNIELVEDHVPVWSASSLDVYPADIEGYTQLVVDNVTKPLHFNALIRKLFDEQNARVFIQVGVGGTVEFINNILEKEEAYAISSASPKRKGIEQIRRVLALLFIQGKPLDYRFLHVLGVGIENQILRKPYTVPTGAPVVKEIPSLKKAVEKYYSFGNLSVPSLPKEAKHPALQGMNNNIQEINKTFRDVVSVQEEMIKLFDKAGFLNQDFQYNNGADLYNNGVEEVQNKIAETPDAHPSDFKEDILVTLDEHRYLLDHAVIRQPENWKFNEDLNPVIPMTMTLELFAETAHRHAPSRKIVRIGPATIVKWMSVETPFKQTIIGKWKNKDTVVMEMEGYATIEVTFADEYPEVPKEYEGPIDIGEEIMPPIPAAEVYERYTFHGPAYQTTTEIKKITKGGILSEIQKGEGKGSLLDSLGQTLGLYLHLTETENMISFPIKVKEINFYQDMYDQTGTFEQTTIIKSTSLNFQVGDVVLKREGKVWAIARTWIGQRFPFDGDVWNVILRPGKYLISQRLFSNVFYYDNTYGGKGRWRFLSMRYLNYPEKEHFASLASEKRDEYLASRIILKDAVNAFITKEGQSYHFPIEIFVEHDSNGKPSVHGFDELENVEVSLAHKGNEMLAIVSDKPVGIDIESIEKRSEEFMKHSYTPQELDLIKDKDEAEWSTRLWVAKEAYSKMIGTGLKGNPKQFEAERIEGESIFIRGVEIETSKYKENYIIGWTKP